jgi:hypothetical protein
MQKTHLKWVMGGLIGIWLCVVGTAANTQAASIPDATVNLRITSVRLGIGWTWGKGYLTLLDGTEYDVRISSFDFLALGIRKVRLRGNVYNLKDVSNFSGVYSKVGTGLAVGMGKARQALQNSKGVVIRLVGESRGLDIEVSLSRLKLRLVE